MKELEECLRVSREIRKINDRICELRVAILSPKNQIITGMPRGGGSDDTAIDKYLIKVEQLQQEKADLTKYSWEQWRIVLEKVRAAELCEQKQSLLFMRFMLGYSWNRTIEKLQEEYPGDYWNKNKVFSTYRTILKEIG